MQTIQDIKRIKPGDQITLTDEQTIKDLIENGVDGAMSGLQLEVQRVRHICESSGLMEWYLADLSGYDFPLFFLAKIVDQDMDMRIYYQPDDIDLGTRRDQLDNGNAWLFENQLDGTSPCDLRYTDTFDQLIDDVNVEFGIKGGPLYGELRDNPVQSGISQPQFVGVIEYAVGAHYNKVENPELIIVEIGGLDADGDHLEEGGLMLVLQGSNVDPNDLSLLSL